MKNRWFCAFIGLLLVACEKKPEGIVLQFSGPAQGTSYSIVCIDPVGRDFQTAIDSIFAVIDQSLSTYQPNSTISRFNREDSLVTDDLHFREMLSQSDKVYQLTGGLFDPTVMPLVRAWGFGPEKVPEMRMANLDSIKKLVGFPQVVFDSEEPSLIRKKQPGVQLDFNAIAQGYTVDVLADFLEKEGIYHYMIEIGGEVRAKGKNPEGKLWTLGIEQPLEIEGISVMSAIVNLNNRALATSGNYRKFYIKDGVKYAHTIDPFSGYPVNHTLLSASVLAETCATADAYATAFMVMGFERAWKFLEENPELGLEAYFISSSKGEGWEIRMTEGMERVVEVP
ncbi:MAG: FAD:protein FMN transferase [Bacteroidia bacterium]|nr:FAD:protein FMN transferase [Bacteroidia bacterium]